MYIAATNQLLRAHVAMALATLTFEKMQTPEIIFYRTSFI
jgi:hypothetical protein